ncbi:MAG: ATP-dependent DNA helicase RecG [Candidatus Komeilibacteria bacterium]|nr:ATP-dependent DNA helicase RecG [Candidatus Komeilibacteria bacterium]
MLTLETSIENLTKVGKTVASRLQNLGIFNVLDLLNYYPFRYDDFSTLKKIKDLQPGDIATVKGKIELLANKRSFKKKMFITECFLSDETGSIKATWFAQPFIAKVLKNGDEVYFSGKVDGDLFNHYLKNPSYEKVSDQTTHTARLVPIYAATEGISQKQLRFLIKQALSVVDLIEDDLPEQIKTFWQLIDLTRALKQIHFPENKAELEQARTRLKFNELLGWHLQNILLKKDVQESLAAPIQFNEEQTKKLVNNLSFQLTDAQRKSAWQILIDMAKTKPMNRLLEGDVGAGKTVVAALAIANAGLNGFQSALLAPTEILAFQHFLAFKEILGPLNLNVALLTRSKGQVFNTADNAPTTLSKAKLLKTIANGEIQLVIGTQALLEDKVIFNKLGLAVIDEQHRFGVEQRQKLREKSGDPATTPHFLSMTATPIPRTLALTWYGDLDISVLDELPPDRKKPITQLFSPNKRNQAYEFILEKIKEGRQAFIICPLIEESDKLGVKSATEEYQKLKEEIFPQLNIGLLHGKLKPKEKDRIMAEFAGGQTDILVATSVVEVGVNVPNASVMIIESAERFGLAQLHQFRGRVNRSRHQAYCLLFTASQAEKSLNRLNTLVNCYDGFKLAEEDLKQRGAGNLLGLQQSGVWNFKLASFADTNLLEQTKKAADLIASDYPEFMQRLKDTTVIHPE